MPRIYDIAMDAFRGATQEDLDRALGLVAAQGTSNSVLRVIAGASRVLANAPDGSTHGEFIEAARSLIEWGRKNGVNVNGQAIKQAAEQASS